jgi:hypothetical protein
MEQHAVLQNQTKIRLPCARLQGSAPHPCRRRAHMRCVTLSATPALAPDFSCLEGINDERLRTAEGPEHRTAVACHPGGRDLGRVRRIVKLMCLVNSTGDYTEQHLVANGCSELLGQVFGDCGTHARSAFGVAQIPLGSCVEIELIAELG